MGWRAAVQEIDRKLAAAPDSGFRSRATHEFRTVCNAIQGVVSLGKARILDFGCGQGVAAAAFALRLPEATVFAVDIMPPRKEWLKRRFQEQVGLELPANLILTSSEPGTLPEEVSDIDLIVAWSVFEHVRFDALVDTMRMLKERLAAGGVFFLQISPLYFSPRGSHLYRYDDTPWVHLLKQTDVLRSLIADANAPENQKGREWEQFETLNRATADDVVEAAAAAGLSVAAEERLRASQEPPLRLTRAYNRDALVTEEIRLLLRPNTTGA